MLVGDTRWRIAQTIIRVGQAHPVTDVGYKRMSERTLLPYHPSIPNAQDEVCTVVNIRNIGSRPPPRYPCLGSRWYISTKTIARAAGSLTKVTILQGTQLSQPSQSCTWIALSYQPSVRSSTPRIQGRRAPSPPSLHGLIRSSTRSLGLARCTTSTPSTTIPRICVSSLERRDGKATRT